MKVEQFQEGAAGGLLSASARVGGAPEHDALVRPSSEHVSLALARRAKHPVAELRNGGAAERRKRERGTAPESAEHPEQARGPAVVRVGGLWEL